MQFLSLDIYAGRYDDFLHEIKAPEKRTLVFTPNPEILVRASGDTSFLSILKKADYLTPDANGLYTGSLIQEGSGYISAFFQTFFQRGSLRKKYGDLIKGSDLTRDLLVYAQEHNKNIMFIDSYHITDPENNFEMRKMAIQSRLGSLFADKYPGLDVTIIFDGEMSPHDMADLIVEKDISYIFSCIGMKTQEERLIEIFDYLPITEKVLGLGVGSSVDYLLGLQERAPSWIRSLGLEWLYRLILDPRGRWRRIYRAVIEFPRLIKNQ